jgi:hypothetical protein
MRLTWKIICALLLSIGFWGRVANSQIFGKTTRFQVEFRDIKFFKVKFNYFLIIKNFWYNFANVCLKFPEKIRS